MTHARACVSSYVLPLKIDPLLVFHRQKPQNLVPLLDRKNTMKCKTCTGESTKFTFEKYILKKMIYLSIYLSTSLYLSISIYLSIYIYLHLSMTWWTWSFNTQQPELVFPEKWGESLNLRNKTRMFVIYALRLKVYWTIAS